MHSTTQVKSMPVENSKEYQDGYTNRLGTAAWQKDTWLGQHAHGWGEEAREREAAAGAASSMPAEGGGFIVLLLETSFLQYMFWTNWCHAPAISSYCVQYTGFVTDNFGITDYWPTVTFSEFVFALAFITVCIFSKIINWVLCIVVVYVMLTYVNAYHHDIADMGRVCRVVGLRCAL